MFISASATNKIYYGITILENFTLGHGKCWEMEKAKKVEMALNICHLNINLKGILFLEKEVATAYLLILIVVHTWGNGSLGLSMDKEGN